MSGYFLYGDFCSGRIWGATAGAGGSWSAAQLLTAGFNISTFNEDEAGEIYVAAYGLSGATYRVTTQRRLAAATPAPALGLRAARPSGMPAVSPDRTSANHAGGGPGAGAKFCPMPANPGGASRATFHTRSARRCLSLRPEMQMHPAHARHAPLREPDSGRAPENGTRPTTRHLPS